MMCYWLDVDCDYKLNYYIWSWDNVANIGADYGGAAGLQHPTNYYVGGSAPHKMIILHKKKIIPHNFSNGNPSNFTLQFLYRYLTYVVFNIFVVGAL